MQSSSVFSNCQKENLSYYLISNWWMRLSRIWRIKQIEEGVIHRVRRPRWITPSQICLILHILRKPNSFIALLFLCSRILTILVCSQVTRIALFWVMYLLTNPLVRQYKMTLIVPQQILKVCKSIKPRKSANKSWPLGEWFSVALSEIVRSGNKIYAKKGEMFLISLIIEFLTRYVNSFMFSNRKYYQN